MSLRMPFTFFTRSLKASCALHISQSLFAYSALQHPVPHSQECRLFWLLWRPLCLFDFTYCSEIQASPDELPTTPKRTAMIFLVMFPFQSSRPNFHVDAMSILLRNTEASAILGISSVQNSLFMTGTKEFKFAVISIHSTTREV